MNGYPAFMHLDYIHTWTGTQPGLPWEFMLSITSNYVHVPWSLLIPWTVLNSVPSCADESRVVNGVSCPRDLSWPVYYYLAVWLQETHDKCELSKVEKRRQGACWPVLDAGGLQGFPASHVHSSGRSSTLLFTGNQQPRLCQVDAVWAAPAAPPRWARVWW